MSEPKPFNVRNWSDGFYPTDDKTSIVYTDPEAWAIENPESVGVIPTGERHYLTTCSLELEKRKYNIHRLCHRLATLNMKHRGLLSKDHEPPLTSEEVDQFRRIVQIMRERWKNHQPLPVDTVGGWVYHIAVTGLLKHDLLEDSLNLLENSCEREESLIDCSQYADIEQLYSLINKSDTFMNCNLSQSLDESIGHMTHVSETGDRRRLGEIPLSSAYSTSLSDLKSPTVPDLTINFVDLLPQLKDLKSIITNNEKHAQERKRKMIAQLIKDAKKLKEQFLKMQAENIFLRGKLSGQDDIATKLEGVLPLNGHSLPNKSKITPESLKSQPSAYNFEAASDFSQLDNSSVLKNSDIRSASNISLSTSASNLKEENSRPGLQLLQALKIIDTSDVEISDCLVTSTGNTLVISNGQGECTKIMKGFQNDLNLEQAAELCGIRVSKEKLVIFNLRESVTIEEILEMRNVTSADQ